MIVWWVGGTESNDRIELYLYIVYSVFIMPTNQTVSVKVNETQCVIPTSSKTLARAVLKSGKRVNGFHVQSGRFPSYGYFLLLKKDITSDLKTSQTTKVTITDGNETVTYENLLFVSSQRLTPNDNDNDVVMIKLVDRRWFALMNERRADIDPYPVHDRYDVSGYPAGTFGTTHDESLRKYWDWAFAAVLLNGDGLVTPSQKTDYPTIIFKDVKTANESSSWHTLNDCLDLMSHRVYQTQTRFDIISDKKVNSTNDALVTEHKRRLVHLKNEDNLNIFYLPQSLVFRYRDINNQDLFNEGFKKSKVYGGSEQVVSWYSYDIDVYNIYDGTHADSSTYETELDTLAGELANLFYDSFPNSNKYDATYFGVIPFEHSPCCNSIEYWHDVMSNRYLTRVKSIDQAQKKWPKIYYDIAAPQVRAVLLQQTGGAAGTSTTVCTFTYDVIEPTTLAVIDTNVSPTTSPNICVRHGVGECEPATFGIMFVNDVGQNAIGIFNEKLKTEAC